MSKQTEDTMYAVHQEVEKLGLRRQFDKQLKKMRAQDKHKYRDTKSRWEYALTKVLKTHNDKKNKSKDIA